MTAEKVAKLETEEDGKPKDADLLSSCTIAIDGYRDAVAKACANAEALGAAKGDRVSLGIEAANASSDVTATDDKDVNAQVDVTIVALTTDSDGRVTSAIGDMAEPALTVMSDGNVMAPDAVKPSWSRATATGCGVLPLWARSGTSTARASALTSRERPLQRSQSSRRRTRMRTWLPCAPLM